MLYLVCSEKSAASLNQLWAGDVTFVLTKDEAHRLHLRNKHPSDVLVCFNSGTIIPGEVLNSFPNRSYNFHAASPEFPGRDPHHWAIYRGAKTYGVTCHIMTERVDDGAIVAVHEFPIPDGYTPQQLRALAESQLYVLFSMTIGKIMFVPLGIEWGKQKTSRQDALDMGDLHGVDQVEADRRRFAFAGFPSAPRKISSNNI